MRSKKLIASNTQCNAALYITRIMNVNQGIVLYSNIALDLSFVVLEPMHNKYKFSPQICDLGED